MASRELAGAVAALGRFLSVYGSGKARQDQEKKANRKLMDANDAEIEKADRDAEAARIANEKSLRQHRKNVDAAMTDIAIAEELPGIEARQKARSEAAKDNAAAELRMANPVFRHGLYLQGKYKAANAKEQSYFDNLDAIQQKQAAPAPEKGAKKGARAGLKDKLVTEFLKQSAQSDQVKKAGWKSFYQDHAAGFGLDPEDWQVTDEGGPSGKGDGGGQPNGETAPGKNILTPDQSGSAGASAPVSTGDTGLDYLNSVVRQQNAIQIAGDTAILNQAGAVPFTLDEIEAALAKKGAYSRAGMMR